MKRIPPPGCGRSIGDDLPALPVTVDGAAGDVPWPKVQRRIVQLIKEDRFYTEAEQDRFDNIDPIAIREALAERGIVNGQVVDPENWTVMSHSSGRSCGMWGRGGRGTGRGRWRIRLFADLSGILATSPARRHPHHRQSANLTHEGDRHHGVGRGICRHPEYEAIPQEKVYDPRQSTMRRYGLSGKSGIPDHRAAGGYGTASASGMALSHLPGPKAGKTV